MPRYKLFLIIILVFLLFFLAIRIVTMLGFINSLFGQQEQADPLPVWLTQDHRRSGPYAFDYIPLNLDDLAKPEGETGEQSTNPPAGTTDINPSGSPYPPGTLADMIWQQKKQDQRYGN
jgi:hypothetical protein